MKSIKQIADELGVSKQRVYRFIQKNHINEVLYESHQRINVKMYDETAETLIKQGILRENASNEVYREAHQNHINEAVSDALLKQLEALQRELDQKNEQIRTLQQTVSESHTALMKAQENLEREQQLHLISQQKILRLETAATEETATEKESFWRRLFGR